MLIILLVALLLGLLWYVSISFCLYVFMDLAYKKGYFQALKMPKTRKVYYILSFTWGLPMNIVGAIVAGVLYILGNKPTWYGWNLCFELPVHFGLSLGIFFIAPINGSIHTKNHEHGHSIQNIWFGPFNIGAVCLPSATRYWIRELKEKKGIPITTEYNDIWFEGQASNSGDAFIEGLNE